MDIVGIFREILFSAFFLYFCLEKKKKSQHCSSFQFRTSRLQTFFVLPFAGEISPYAPNYTLYAFARFRNGLKFCHILDHIWLSVTILYQKGWPNICNKNKFVRSYSTLVNLICFVFLLVRVCSIAKISSESRQRT